ncbi:unnamed protein product [Lepeophtheirus salmonis]|uniref:(salmon louse) hypothetical protein n=1 Tax=Lepeophtheirus salmonis TaxID=72036 RepID=A0A7R8H768_LEPSM|nr:unnamed protein product [Lepeophtheirus salmonis]CAF2914767.1 unnamed protein product [Lepeophtheirus salmonis]
MLPPTAVAGKSSGLSYFNRLAATFRSTPASCSSGSSSPGLFYRFAVLCILRQLPYRRLAVIHRRVTVIHRRLASIQRRTAVFSNPEIWFDILEISFKSNKLTYPITKFAHAASLLPTDILSKVSDVIYSLGE